MRRLGFIPKVFDIRYMIEPQIRPCCGPIFFARPSKSWVRDSITANGSFGLVDTGEMKLLVTCSHVWDKFEKSRRENPDLRIFVCPDPESVVALDPIQPIDQDGELDIASFDMEPLLEQCHKSRFVRFNCACVPQVKEGDPLAFIGYPGRVEACTSIGVRFRRTPYVTFASDVSDTRVVSDISRMKRLKRRSEDEGPENEYGGISGSPCFLVRRDLQVELVAFTIEKGLNILKFTLARCLSPDGTIRRL